MQTMMLIWEIGAWVHFMLEHFQGWSEVMAFKNFKNPLCFFKIHMFIYVGPPILFYFFLTVACKKRFIWLCPEIFFWLKD